MLNAGKEKGELFTCKDLQICCQTSGIPLAASGVH